MSWHTVNGILPIKSYALFSRYLAGGVALRESRATSRREIFLQDSGVSKPSKLIRELNETINRYNNTVIYLAQSKFGVEDICQANHILLANDKSGKSGLIRKYPLVNKLKNHKISLPAPTELKKSLENALSHLSSGCHPVEKSIYISAVLLGLHPFSDGNGRTARAVFDAIMLRYGAAAISPFYFIFQEKNMKQHIISVALTAISADFSIKGEFWDYYKDWHGPITIKVDEIINEAKNIVKSKIFMLPISVKDIEHINKLWANPIINPNSNNLSPQIISTLVNSGLITPKRTTHGVIYCCDTILLMYEKLDNILLSRV